MTYGRHIRAGVLGSMMAVIAWLLVLVAPALLAVARARREGGGGSASVLIDTNHLLVAAAAGFAAGWYWRTRRIERIRFKIPPATPRTPAE